MRSMLDKAGFQKVWTAIKNKFVAKVAGKDLSTNDYIDEEQAAVNALRGTDSANVPFLAQLAAPFTGDADSVIQDAPDDATLDTLTDGIWRISSTARISLGIPKDRYAVASPTGTTARFHPGGILFLCTLSDISQYFPTFLLSAASTFHSSAPAPARFALFSSIR